MTAQGIPHTFLIARDDSRDDRLAQAAAAGGYRVERLRLLAFEPGPDAAALATRLAGPPDGLAIAWTSRRAAEALLAAAPPLAGCPHFALGEESAAPLRAAGIPVGIPRGNSEAMALAAHIAERAHEARIGRVLVLQGDRALPDLAAGLRAAGLDVETLTVYRTRLLTPPVDALVAEIRAGRVAAVAFFSPSGAEALERLLDAGTLSRFRAEVLALARGETTYRALIDRGYHRAAAPSGMQRDFEMFAARRLEPLRSETT